MSDKEIKTFCRNSGTFSIPLIQLKFSVTYKEAARVVDELVGAGEASPLADELSYEYIIKERVAPSNGRKVVAVFHNSESPDIIGENKEYLQGHGDDQTDGIKRDESEKDEVTDDDEEEENRRRREYLERRRLELMARLRAEMAENCDIEDDEENDDLFDDDDDNDEEEYDNPFEDDKFNMTAHSLFAKSEEEELHKKLLDLLIDEERNSKLAVSALKLCAGEGYVSSWLLCKNLGIDENTADFVCFWLYVNDFIRRDVVDENKYLLDMPESLFFACCQEAEERKKSLGQLASTLKNIGEQKQKKEHEKKISNQRHTNSIQFRKVVRAKLIALVCTDLKMTRTKAITKAEGCLFAAYDIGNDNAVAVYEKVIFELNNMSDYMFNRLKSQQAD